jgi:hypothetical protein
METALPSKSSCKSRCWMEEPRPRRPQDKAPVVIVSMDGTTAKACDNMSSGCAECFGISICSAALTTLGHQWFQSMESVHARQCLLPVATAF